MAMQHTQIREPFFLEPDQSTALRGISTGLLNFFEAIPCQLKRAKDRISLGWNLSANPKAVLGYKVVNELDEVTGPVNADGRDTNVIDKQLPVTIGAGTKFFELALWVGRLLIAGII